jgi:hydroxyacylglutathione hydrolase
MSSRASAGGSSATKQALVKVAQAPSPSSRASLTMAASRVWSPRPVSLEGLEMFNQPYRDMRVNAYLVRDPATNAAAFFDTATDSIPLARRRRKRSESRSSRSFLTHTHNDHLAALDALKAAFPEATAYSNRAEPWPGTETFSEGATFSIGALKVTTRTTSGHSKGGTTYLVEGLARPLAIVGDAIFAGSMGGGMVSFDDAWKNNREKILTLPDETVLCPGHGPLTSVSEEKRNNPFFAAEFLRMTHDPFLILASGSPRRRDLLTEAGYRFQVENPGIEENEDTSLPIRQLTAENARDKAAAVSARFPEAIVIAADTLVLLGDTVLSKPADREEATRMLASLNGRSHEVFTAVALRHGHAGKAVDLTVTTSRPFQTTHSRRAGRLPRPHRSDGQGGRLRGPGSRRPHHRPHRGLDEQRHRPAHGRSRRRPARAFRDHSGASIKSTPERRRT